MTSLSSDILECWCFHLLIFWFVDVLECRRFSVLAFWSLNMNIFKCSRCDLSTWGTTKIWTYIQSDWFLILNAHSYTFRFWWAWFSMWKLWWYHRIVHGIQLRIFMGGDSDILRCWRPHCSLWYSIETKHKLVAKEMRGTSSPRRCHLKQQYRLYLTTGKRPKRMLSNMTTQYMHPYS